MKKIVLATVLAFSLVLTACGVEEKNEAKQENNTVVNENSSKENSTSESEKESNIKEFQVNVPAGYIEKNGVYVNTSDESKTITVEISVKKSQNEIDSAKGVSTQALVRIPKNVFIGYKKENFNGYTCYLVKTTEATKVYLEHNEQYLVTIEFNGIMCEDDEFKSFMNSFKVLDTKRVGYAGWFDAKIPEGYVETKSDNELTWEFTNQSDQSKRIIIELVKLSDGFNKKAKDISYEHCLIEKLEGKEFIRFGSQGFSGFACYILELKSMTRVYFDIDSNYSVQIRFCGIKYEDEEFNSVMKSFEVFDGDIEENYKAYLNKNANTQDNEQKIEADDSKSKIDTSMDSKNAEYNKIKKTAIVLNISKNDNGYYKENEILYDASGKTVIGVYVKHVTPDYENLESRKSNAEETLKKNGWEYYDVKIVDNHIEMEYVSTTAKTIASNGFTDPLDIEKQVDEASGYKCTVTDNTK